MKVVITSTPNAAEPSYQNLEPILRYLLDLGNAIATDYRWGQDRTGYFCTLTYRIDKAAVLSKFTLPSDVYFSDSGALWCGATGCRIQFKSSSCE
uniref:hypothetical protein n=1 Tax=Thaumasiovibrio occultus TaxID=1891184 RepID=UPI000B35AE70|nr:hypothetical protein [Thaumasiovibrio occultus]